MSIIERFDTHAIAHQEKCALLVIPERESEHAVQSWETLLTPLCPGGQQNFSVCLRVKAVAFAGELFAQLAIVVNLSVENYDQSAVARKHRLVARRAGIDDGQTPVAERDPLL